MHNNRVTGIYGLNSIGIFPPHSAASDILTLHQSRDRKLLATGDVFGAIKLFRNPACDYFAPFKQYSSHGAGGVSKVAFTGKDMYLLSIGQCDRTMVQWRVNKSADLPDSKPPASTEALKTPAEADADADAEAAGTEDFMGDFASTFVIKGVDFLADEGGAERGEDDSSSLVCSLRAVAGVGCDFANSGSGSRLG